MNFEDCKDVSVVSDMSLWRSLIMHRSCQVLRPLGASRGPPQRPMIEDIDAAPLPALTRLGLRLCRSPKPLHSRLDFPDCSTGPPTRGRFRSRHRARWYRLAAMSRVRGLCVKYASSAL